MVKSTIKLPRKELRMFSKEVSLPLNKEDKDIIENMINYLQLAAKEDNDLRPGIGIAAVQLGFLKRMFLVDFINEQDDRIYELLINPKKISESTGYAALKGGEGCLSVKETEPNQNGLVHRKSKIIVSGYSYFQKKEVEITISGFGAIVYQHELDHLDGILFIDKIDQKNPWEQKENEMII